MHRHDSQNKIRQTRTKQQINGYAQNKCNCLGMTKNVEQQAKTCDEHAILIATNKTSNKQTNGYDHC